MVAAKQQDAIIGNMLQCSQTHVDLVLDNYLHLFSQICIVDRVEPNQLLLCGCLPSQLVTNFVASSRCPRGTQELASQCVGGFFYVLFYVSFVGAGFAVQHVYYRLIVSHEFHICSGKTKFNYGCSKARSYSFGFSTVERLDWYTHFRQDSLGPVCVILYDAKTDARLVD